MPIIESRLTVAMSNRTSPTLAAENPNERETPRMRLKYRIAGIAGSAVTTLALTGGGLLAGAAPASAAIYDCYNYHPLGTADGSWANGWTATCVGSNPHDRFRVNTECVTPDGYQYVHYGNWVSSGHASYVWCAPGDSTTLSPSWIDVDNWP